MDPREGEEVSDEEAASPQIGDSGDSEDYDDEDDVKRTDEEDEEDDDDEEASSARALPPSRVRSPIEIEVLSSDEEDEAPMQAPSSQTVAVSSSPIASQRSEELRASDEEEELGEEEEYMEQDEYESEDIVDSPAEQSIGEEEEEEEDENKLQISEQDAEERATSPEKVESEETEEKINYEFSKPFEPKEPLDLPVMDPLTQDLMDSVEELKILPDQVLSKLTNLWANKNSELRAMQEQLTASGDFEQRLENIDVEVGAESSVEQTLEALNEALAKKQRELKLLQIQRDSARGREEESIRQLRRKDEEVQRIVSENTCLSTQLSQAITSKCEALMKLQNIERQEILLKNKEWRLDNENASLKANCNHLSENLEATMRELTQLKHESSLRMTDLEISLVESKTEFERAESQITALKESLAQNEHRVENLQELLRESRDSGIALQEAHTQEVQAKTHMSRLYQEQTIEAEKMASSYLAAIEELQGTVKLTAEKYGDLETRFEMDKVNWDREVEQKNKVIFSLREELANANVLLEKYSEVEMEEQVSALAPSATSARKMVQSDLSFTEIYSMYKSKEQELELVNKEREHLRNTMQAVVKELEERAPIFAKDKEALNVTVMENERLISDFDKMAQDLQNVKEEAHQSKRLCGLLKRDKDRMQVQIDDLSRQAVILLNEVQNQRPSYRTKSSLDSFSEMSPNDMITERLLPFRDVEELQQRNVELMAAIRELTNQVEEAHLAKESGIDIVKLSEQLDNALVDLNNLKEKEKQHEILIDQLTEQRNHFRDISKHGRSSQDIALSPMKMDASPMRRSLVPPQSAEERELKQKLLQTQEAFDRTTKQIDGMIKENKEVVDGLKKQIEDLKTDANEKNVIVSKLKAVLENREGKLGSAQSKVQELTKQVEVLEAKAKSQSGQLSCEMKKRQELMLELHTTRCNLNRSETALNKLKSELDSSRAMEESLKNECATWKKSYEERGSIQSSVEQMRVSLERSRTEGKDLLIHQLDETRLETAALRKRLQEETKRLRDELVQLQSALEAERVKVTSKETEIAAAKNETVLVEERLGQAQRDVQALRAHRNPSVDNCSQTEVFVSEEVEREKRMTQRASEFEVLISSLRFELEKAKGLATEYKNVADATERSLMEAKETGRLTEEKLNNSVEKWEATEEGLKATITSLEKDLSESRAKVQTASAEATQQLEIVQRQLTKAESQNQQLQLVVDESQVIKSALNAAEEEVHRLGERLANETEQNMKNMQAFVELKNEVTAAAAEKAELIEELEQQKRTVAQLERELEEKEQQLENATFGHEQQLQQLKEHNSALYNQLQTMGAELSALKHGNSSSDRENLFGEGSSQLNISTDDSQSAEQLMQVMKFLRREKEAASMLAEELKTKLAEVKARLEVAEQQLKDEASRGGRSSPEGPELVTRARYEALVRRLETMNALSESARLQREECASLRKQSELLQEKIKCLLEETSAAHAQTRRFEEKAGALQVELALVKGEASRWRTCANQLTEKANQANPEELKRLLQERENLQKQLQAERDMATKEREEARKMRETAAEREQQLAAATADVTQLRADLVKISADHTKLSAANKELSDKHKDLASKELTVRRIAKKYKTQFDQLQAEVKQKELADAASQKSAVDEQVKQLETKLAEMETKEAERTATIQELQQKLDAVNNQITTKEAEIEKIQSEFASLKEKEEKMRAHLSNASRVFAEKKKEFEDAKVKIASLTEEVTKTQQLNDEFKVRNTALQSQYESRTAKSEKEIQELRLIAEKYEALMQQTHPQELQAPAEEAPPQEIQQQPGNEKQLMRTANVPPFAARGRGQGQAAAVTPTSRVGTPMALLRPIKAEDSQLVAPSTSAGSSTVPRPLPVQVKTEQPPLEVEPMLEESPSANVLLVRPHEVHMSSSNQATPPPTGQAASSSQPALKRKAPEEEPSVEQEEPKAKQLKSEVPPVKDELEEEEEEANSSTLPEAADPEEVALADSDEENVEGEQEVEILDEVDDEEDPEENLDQEENEEEREAASQDEDFTEDVFEDDVLNDDPVLGQQEQEENEAEEVLILDDDEDSSPSAQDSSEPPSQAEPPSIQQPNPALTLRPIPYNPALLSLPQHQGFEEVGDFGIVPSTPTLFARQNVFSEAISSAPQVPQVSQSRMVTMQEAGSSLQTQATSAPERLEVADDSSTGRSVPSTPLLSSPQETVPPASAPDLDDSVIEITEEEFGESQNSGSTVPSITITPASEAQPGLFVGENQPGFGSPRGGGNRARRSGGNFGPGRATGRPTPITWSQPEEQQRGRGRAQRRPRPPRGNPFQPLDFM